MAGPMPRRVTDILQQDDDLSTFNNLVRRSKAIVDIDSDEPFTVFAPTDAAFEKLPEGSLGRLSADEARLREVVFFHVASGMYPEAELREREEVPTLAGKPALLECVGHHTYVGGAMIEVADQAAENGFVHTLDTVMMPD
jgi:uncharacterized surface protein with fasciclin (FAS1) repeats